MGKKLICLMVIYLACAELLSQSKDYPQKPPYNFPNTREADVLWAKRIWRLVRSTEKINHYLFMPTDSGEHHPSLWDIIKFHLINEPGSITAYRITNPENICENHGDEFIYPIVYNGPYDSTYTKEINQLLFQLDYDYILNQKYLAQENRMDSVTMMNPAYSETELNTFIEYPTKNKIPITSEQIVQWELKEDWFFDKQRSVLDVRIIGICPHVQQKESSTGKIAGTKPLFWIYFPQLRYILKNYAVSNSRNTNDHLTFEDMFIKRKFHSIIIKDSSIQNKKTNDIYFWTDSHPECERIKNDILEMEHDLWEY